MFAVEDIRHLIMVLIFSTTRFYGAIRVAPFMKNSLIPLTARNAFILSLAIFVLPVNLSMSPQHISFSLHLPILLIKEVAIGVLIGFASGIPFWAAHSIGFLLDYQRGASIASTFYPNLGEQSSPLGIFFMQLLITIIFASGQIFFFIDFILHSFIYFPIFSFFPDLSSPRLLNFIFNQFNWIMLYTIIIAGPLLFLNFLVDFGLGMINRFVPQMNVFFLSFGIKSSVVFLGLILYYEFMILFFTKNMVRLDMIMTLLKPSII